MQAFLLDTEGMYRAHISVQSNSVFHESVGMKSISYNYMVHFFWQLLASSYCHNSYYLLLLYKYMYTIIDNDDDNDDVIFSHT